VGTQTVSSPLAPGQSVVVNQPWTVRAGSQVLRVTADAASAILEANEANNERTTPAPQVADESAPQILRVSPEAGSKVRGRVAVEIFAVDASGVANYQLDYSANGQDWTSLGSAANGRFTWDTAPLSDGSYSLRATATDPLGNRSTFEFQYQVDNQAPPAVQLTATPGEFRVDLRWSASDALDFAYYRLYRSTAPNSGFQPINGKMTQETFADRQVTAGTTYFYRLTVFDHVGNESVPSNVVSAAALLDSTPPVIRTLTPAEGTAAATALQLRLDASDNVAVTRYRFEFSIDGTAWSLIAEGANASVSWAVDQVPHGAYRVCATATDAQGNATSRTQLYQVDHLGPNAPANLRLEAAELALIVAWDTVGAPDFHSYELQRSQAGGPFEVVLPSTSSSLFVDRGVTAGLTYTYRVVAVDQNGNRSDPSNQATQTPLPDTTPPLVRRVVPGDGAALRGQVTLQAEATDNIAVAQFTFAFAAAGTQTWTTVGTDTAPRALGNGIWQGAVSWNTDPLAEGNYDVRVTARDAGNLTAERVYTVSIDRTPPAAPEAPSIENPRTGGTLKLSWTASSDPTATGYRLYRSETQGGNGQPVGGVLSALEFWDTELENARTYYYTLTAVDAAGNQSSRSPERPGTPTAEADLAVSTLRFDPANPTRGRSTTIVATLDSTGPAAADAEVAFYLGTPRVLLGRTTVRVPANGATQARLAWTPDLSGAATLTAVLAQTNVLDTNSANDERAVEIAVNLPPVAKAGDNRSGNWNQPIAFDGKDSTDPDGLIQAYHWDFGNGQTSINKTTSHAYQTPGIFTVVLTVTDNRGAQSRDTLQVIVNDTRADLVISRLAWNPLEPQERDQVTITATLTNLGNGSTRLGFFTTFYIDGAYQGYQRVDQLLGIGQSLEVPFAWKATKGLHTVKVVADDLQNNVVERSETNNSATTALTLQQVFFPDLIVTDLTANLPAETVSSEVPLTAQATLRNDGDADAFDFWVSLYREATFVTRLHVNELIAGAQTDLTFAFPPVVGQHTLRVVADDPVSAVLEADETNNARELALPALTLAYPDLVIEDIRLLPRDTVLSDGTSLDITATVANRGSVPLDRPFVLNYYVDGQFVGSRQVSSLAAGASSALAFQARAYPGTHTIRVVADEDNRVTEAEEGNNELATETAALTILYPDLIVSEVELLTPNVFYGQKSGFRCKVSNQTVVSTLDTFYFALYLDGQRIALQQLPKLTGFSSQTFVVEWQVNADPAVPHTIKAVVDSRQNIPEQDETNNEYVFAQSTFQVQDNFVIDLEVSGGELGTNEQVIFVNRSTAQFQAAVTMGSRPGRLGPADGVWVQLTVTQPESGETVFDDRLTYLPSSGRFAVSLPLLSYRGQYSVRAAATDGVKESAAFLSLLVIEELNFTVQTDQSVYARGQPVAITGQATKLDGEPMADQKVALMISKGAPGAQGIVSSSTVFDPSTRVFETQTGASGEFAYTFNPAWGDAGEFTVDAFIAANLVGTSAQTSFAIVAVNLDPSRVHATTSTNSTFTKVFTLENLSDVPLTGTVITLVDEDPADNVTGSLTHSIPGRLQAGVRLPIRLEVRIPENAPPSAAFRIEAVTAEGATASSRIRFTLVPATPVPVLAPQRLEVGGQPGGQLAQQVTLTNRGLGTMTGIQVLPPAILPWVKVGALSDTRLAPGASVTLI